MKENKGNEELEKANELIKTLTKELEELKKVELITLPKKLFAESILSLNDPVNWKANTMNNIMFNLQKNANEVKEDKKE